MPQIKRGRINVQTNPIFLGNIWEIVPKKKDMAIPEKRMKIGI
jgi:hypothetical protein